jgi:hypothetical protein
MMTRIYREVGTREGWLQLSSEDARQLIMETFFPLMKSMEPTTLDEVDGGRSELSQALSKEEASSPVLQQTHRSAIMTVLTPGLMQEAHTDLLQQELNARAGK